MDNWKALAPPESNGPAFTFAEEHTPPLPRFRSTPLTMGRLQPELPISTIETKTLRASIFQAIRKAKNLWTSRPARANAFCNAYRSKSGTL